MLRSSRRIMAVAAGILLGILATADRWTPLYAQDKQAAADPLPSWNDGPAKKAILDFVAKVTREGGPDFVPVAERIAVFDNDGTLWVEQPLPTQLFFALDRVKALAPKHPEWKYRQPFKAVLEGDHKALAAAGLKGVAEIVMATHAGMTTDEYAAAVKDWLKTAKHPKLNRPILGTVYLPMQEVLAYLRANGFKTYIVSGGGVEFMRVFAQDVYGVPPEQVIGSTILTKYEVRDGKPVLVREPKLDFFDDKAGKPVAINKFIGRRPVMAFGNSDGDFEMLEYTTTGPGPRFGLLVHHTDAEREFKYDREHVPSGQLVKGLDEAPRRGWTVADMKKDWKVIYPIQK
jgi:phosphoserine phosphatase